MRKIVQSSEATSEASYAEVSFIVDRQGMIRVHPLLGRVVVVTKVLLPDSVVRDQINAYVGLLKRPSDNSLRSATQPGT